MATAVVSALAREALTLILCFKCAHLALTAAVRAPVQATVHLASTISH